MINISDYVSYDGVGLAELIKKGQVSSSELIEAAIQRADSINSKINAIITPMFEHGRNRAKNSTQDTFFGGIPILLKDAHHAIRGFPMSSGSKLLRNYVPDFDAEIVRRFDNAGLIPIGKTNAPEFKNSYLTEPTAFGPTRNPWNLDYASGGSSGGSAAAVAARIVPIASATDEGGSIRVPASYCGLFGLKPSRGRNPVGPKFEEARDGASCSHVVTRSVRDSAAVLDAVAGLEPGAPYGIPAPEKPFLEAVDNEPKKLRVAFHIPSAYGRQIHPECRIALDETCRLLESIGHIVEETQPPFSEEEVAINYGRVSAGNFAVFVEGLIQNYGRKPVLKQLELTSLAIYSLGRQLKTQDFIRAKQRWREFGFRMSRMMETYDMYLTPTLGEPPLPVGSMQPGAQDRLAMKFGATFLGQLLLKNRRLNAAILEEIFHNILRVQMPLTIIANLTGQPAMSVPLHWTESGLPCGVQFIGRLGDEVNLLRLAGQLERARPWSEKVPNL